MATKKKAEKQSAKALALGATKAEREKLITDIVKTVDQQFGKGAVGTVRGKNAITIPDVEVIETGSLGLNNALGIGGWPKGRVVEIYGPESSGKTTMALHAIANAQAQGALCGFVDAEHALDVTYAEALGVSMEDLLLTQPDNGEQALNIVETLVKAGVQCVVVDSVAALTPKKELEGDMGDHHPGAQARLMSQAMRKLAGVVRSTGTLLIFINQTREKIGVMFGSPVTTPGGKALKFYASIRAQINRIGSTKQGDELVGNKTKVKVVKNKLAPPFKTTEFEIVFGEGICWQGELLDYAVTLGVLKKSGAWYSMGEDRVGMGRKNVIERLKEDDELVAALRAALP